MKIPGPFVVYLLHFAHPVHPAHYVGITTPKRLPARMREHAAGRGSLVTTAACTLGLEWSLAATFHTEDRTLEKKLAGLRPASSWCPICRGEPPIRDYQPTKMAATLEWRPDALGFKNSVEFRNTTFPQSQKKGPKRRLQSLSLFFGQS